MSVSEVKGTAPVSNWINGRSVLSTSGCTGDLHNPATGELIDQVAFASVTEVDDAVAAAKAARETARQQRMPWVKSPAA